MGMRILWIVLIVTAWSCKPKLPAGVLSEPDMVKVLMEIYIGEEKISRAAIPYDSVTRLSPLLRQRILNRINIPDSVFKKSMDYYMANPKQLERIYTVLVDSLSLREQSMPATNALPR